MKKADSLQAFVSFSKVGGYRGEIGILMWIVVSGSAIANVAMDVNAFSLSTTVAAGVILLIWSFLLVKKDSNKLLLFEAIQGVLVFFTLWSLMVNFLHERDFFLGMIIFAISTMIVSAAIAIVIIINRLKRGYYIGVKRRAIDVAIIPTIAIISSMLAFFTVSSIGQRDFLIILLSALASSICGYMGTESLMRYYIACRYNLFSAVEINS